LRATLLVLLLRLPKLVAGLALRSPHSGLPLPLAVVVVSSSRSAKTSSRLVVVLMRLTGRSWPRRRPMLATLCPAPAEAFAADPIIDWRRSNVDGPWKVEALLIAGRDGGSGGAAPMPACREPERIGIRTAG
jgi:hypothetical protein